MPRVQEISRTVTKRVVKIIDLTKSKDSNVLMTYEVFTPTTPLKEVAKYNKANGTMGTTATIEENTFRYSMTLDQFCKEGKKEVVTETTKKDKKVLFGKKV